jgi:hypothetical protein
MDSSRSAHKIIWFVTFAVMVLSVGCYGWLVSHLNQNPGQRALATNLTPDFNRFFLYATDLLLIATWGWTRFKIDKKVGTENSLARLTPAESSTLSISALVMAGVLILAVGIYGWLIFHLNQKPLEQLSINLPTWRPFVIHVGGASIVAAWEWLRLKTDGKIGAGGRPVQLTSTQFLIYSIISLALAQVCAVTGLTFFFLGAHLDEFYFFIAGTLLFDFLVVLPRGLKFWSTRN